MLMHASGLWFWGLGLQVLGLRLKGLGFGFVQGLGFRGLHKKVQVEESLRLGALRSYVHEDTFS